MSFNSRVLTRSTKVADLGTIAIITVILLAVGGCGGGNSASGGITIQKTDATGPELTFGVGQPGGQNVSVTNSGSAQIMTLNSKTGSLNVLATAKDPESGIRVTEIWMNTKITTCDATSCTVAGPALAGRPEFQSSSGPKQPGEKTAESSILGDALDLARVIPQRSLLPGESVSAELEMWAESENFLAGRTKTQSIKATWQESR